jgi:hypothetical protein
MVDKTKIGKLNQAKGHRFEILAWNKVKHKQTIARAISSGSKGIVDVWALERKKLRLILCKTNGYLEPRERNEINWFLRVIPKWVQIELWYYKSKRKIGKMYITKGWEDRYNRQYDHLFNIKGV